MDDSPKGVMKNSAATLVKIPKKKGRKVKPKGRCNFRHSLCVRQLVGLEGYFQDGLNVLFDYISSFRIPEASIEWI
jgi:hypothetical protein